MTYVPVRNRAYVPQAVPEQLQILAEGRVSEGMNTYYDPADLANGVLVLARNAQIEGDRIFRTNGSEASLATKPNSLAILTYANWRRFNGTNNFFRFTLSTLHNYVGGVWAALTGTLTGTATDRIRWMTTSDATRDYFFFTNNGVDEVQSVNNAVTDFAPLGNAPKAKFITGFANRVIVANYTAAGSENPVLVGWSGDLNFAEFNPLVDISAGSNPLVEAQSDFTDPITGLFGFASVLLILREQSLWIATKRPVASNPFAFQAAFPSVGCDTPNSACSTKNGICWYDSRENQVYWYEVGKAPREIGDPIRNTLRESLNDKDMVFASYDSRNGTYILTVPSQTTITTRVFKCKLATGAWTYDEIDDVYCTIFQTSGNSVRSINALTGTIDSLVGTINDLGDSTFVDSEIYYGLTDGEIRVQTATDENAQPMILESKVYRLPTGDQYISRMMFLFTASRSGAGTLEYRKNNGDWKYLKAFSISGGGSRERFYATKLIACNEFQWRLMNDSGAIELLEYKIELTQAMEDKEY